MIACRSRGGAGPRPAASALKPTLGCGFFWAAGQVGRGTLWVRADWQSALQPRLDAWQTGTETALHISLFITCYNDTLFPQTGKAVVAVLERLGHTVEFRQAQTCCGQMHYNTGYQAEAMPLMRHFLE